MTRKNWRLAPSFAACSFIAALFVFGWPLTGADFSHISAADQKQEEEQYEPYYPEDEPIDVCPPVVANYRLVKTIDFADPKTTIDGWEGFGDVKLSRGPRSLIVEMNRSDPYFFSCMINDLPAGKLLVRIRFSHTNEGLGQIFFATATHSYEEAHSTIFRLKEDDQPHDYVVPLDVDAPIARLRFDLGGDKGRAEVERVEFFKIETEPLKFGVATLESGKLVFEMLAADPNVSQTADMQFYGFDVRKVYPKSTVEVVDKAVIDRYYPQKRPFEEMEIVAQIRGDGKELSRRYFAFNESACDKAPGDDRDKDEAPTLRSGKLAVRFAPDASGAEIFRDGVRVAVISPLVYEEGDGADILAPKRDYAKELLQAPADFAPVKNKGRLAPVFRSLSDDGTEIEFSLCEIPFQEARQALNEASEKSTEHDPFAEKTDVKPENRDEKLAAAVGFLRFRLDDETLGFEFDAPRKVHAPVVRVLGEMQQATFPGVEYLEKGEHSSSTADIKTEERFRYAPSIYWVTQPWSAITTDRGSVTMLYDNPKTQPVFAVPDFIDGDASSSRMNLCASGASGKLRIAAPEPLEAAILWAVKSRGLPEPPTPPLAGQAQKDVVLAALQRSIIATPIGWAHALTTGKEPYTFTPSYGSDFVSTIWEITGKLPETPRLDFGGSHINNFASYFVSGKGEVIVDYFKGRSERLAKQIQPDGSFRYYGKFLWGAKTDYASGSCGNELYAAGETWSYTGDKKALATLLKGADFMNAQLTPRGAQTWELSLHTPDIMGSSRCCMANVWAYEATGEQKYLDAAVRWAITGLPFVYLWEDRTLRDFESLDKPVDGPVDRQPMMKYATIAVFGATGWVSPNWMGRPVQWCGLDYAHALIMLDKYDKTLDWRKIAEGIVASAECQLCVREDLIGLLPDSFQIDTQERYPCYINPCVVYMLRRILDGEHTNMSVVDVKGVRLASPFPAKVEGDVVKISAPKGVSYQIMINGEEIRTVESQGEDEIRF